MANKDFKVKNGLDIQSPLPVSMGGTGQTSTTNSLNSLLPSQAGNTNKVLATDGTNTTWVAQALAYERGGTASRPQSPTVGDLYYNTDNNYFESYTANGWFPIAAAPGIPTGVTATNQPTNRAYNSGQMSVAFTPNSSGGAPSSFIVTPSPTTSPSTFTGGTSPITVTGLASSTQYTYTVQATSPYGTSSASSASTGVTATTVPQAPTIGTATAGNATASVTFTANATGGSAITSYTVTSSPGNITASGASSPITVTGLTNGTSYTFTVTATNANGTSAASAASNSVTPASGTQIEYLVLAGGGGAGTDYAGGGGAGGYRTNYGGTKITINNSTQYTITVGGGGYAGNRSNGSNGGPGSPSGIYLSGNPVIESAGGGYGAQYWAVGGNGGSGGGGGGGYGGEVYNNGGLGNTPATTPSQGNNGGKGYGPNNYPSNRYGGGGGSPVAAGTDSTPSSPGVGAAAISNSISGSAVSYGRGGDGCTSQGAQPTRGTTVNRGEGGSGGGENIQGTAGSSGIVVIKAAVQASSTTGSPSNPSTGVYIFNGNGTITF